MDELVARMVKQAGINEDQARKAIGILLNFLNKAAPKDKMQQLIAAIPGAGEAIASKPKGGFMGSIGGMAGALAALGELNALGLDMSQVQQATRETIAFARGKAGDDVVDDIVASIPGISQYL